MLMNWRCNINRSQESTVDISLHLIDWQFRLHLYVTSGNVTLTSDSLLTIADLVNTSSADDGHCSFQVEIIVDQNHVAFSGNRNYHLRLLSK